MESQTIIELKKVSKEYYQVGRKICALRDVDLTVGSGDICGIIGLSGAGKSTLIRCLARLVLPSAGGIYFYGKDLSQMDKRALRDFRKSIGMVFQHFNLLNSRTVSGNIAYPLEIAEVAREERERRIDELLRLVGLSEKKESYPPQLSGGEKQRVGIARALANYPQVLLCDEATSSLDPKTTREILSLLKDINKKLGVTIVLITHEMEVIKQICDQVAVIEKGQIVEKGLVAEVFADPQHGTTKHFLQYSAHEIPKEFFRSPSPHRKLLRLRFKGQAASEPIIAEMIKRFQVDANILLGWIDRLQTATIGTLIIELEGAPENIDKALEYLKEKKVHYEFVENDS